MDIVTDLVTTYYVLQGDLPGLYVAETGAIICYPGFDSVYNYLSQGGAATNGCFVRVMGEVSAPITAISLRWTTADTAAAHSLVVGTTGIVSNFNTTSFAIELDGPQSRLANAGFITGGGGVTSDNLDGGTIQNSGQILALGLAAVQINASNTVKVVNTGEITGGKGVELVGSVVNLTNDGEITGTSGAAVDASAGGGQLTLRNAGVLSGIGTALIAGSSIDWVTNLGDMRGDVFMGGGADYFDGHKGRLDGRLFGEGGDDFLWGGTGDDFIYGDALFGASGGNDTLNGGKGDDTLTGGAGADDFVIRRGGGDDEIVDFTHKTDKLDLSAFHFDTFDAVKALARASHGSVLLDLDGLGGGSILLDGLALKQFTAPDAIL